MYSFFVIQDSKITPTLAFLSVPGNRPGSFSPFFIYWWVDFKICAPFFNVVNTKSAKHMEHNLLETPGWKFLRRTARRVKFLEPDDFSIW